MRDPREIESLTERERDCLARYLETLAETLGDELEQVLLFGSVARGETWPPGMPIRSDLDLVVVTRKPLDERTEQALLDATYPLFLECGRQIGPQFRTRGGLRGEFAENLERDAIELRLPEG